MLFKWPEKLNRKGYHVQNRYIQGKEFQKKKKK
jgi:hypothetical protein